MSIEIIAGVDEAGAGPFAGPLSASAVILDPSKPISGLDDSKKLNEKQREELYSEIIEKALCWSLVYIEPSVIDEINILEARMLAMRKAIEALSIEPSKALIDGNRIPKGLSIPAEAIIKGDGLIPAISAASIIAKVSRDRLMNELDKKYPEYGFAKHKGYGTKYHIECIEKYGICEIHRKSYKPIKKYL